MSVFLLDILTGELFGTHAFCDQRRIIKFGEADLRAEPDRFER